MSLIKSGDHNNTTMSILIIDDNKDFIYYMKRVNKKYNMGLYFSLNTEDALMRDDLMSFDKILVDFCMDTIDGKAFIKEYRAKGGKAKIILCTSLIIGYDLGVDGKLTKPFTLEEFKKIIE